MLAEARGKGTLPAPLFSIAEKPKHAHFFASLGIPQKHWNDKVNDNMNPLSLLMSWKIWLAWFCM